MMTDKLVVGLTAALALMTAGAGSGVTWIDGTKLPMEGRAFAETIGGPYGRVPLAYADRVTAADRMHGQDSCGVAFRFKTDSRKLRFRWTLGNSAKFVRDRYMTQMAMGGIDVYVETPKGCHLHTDGGTRGGPDIGKPDAATELEMPWTPGDTAVVYLPIRGIVTSFALGVDEGAKIEESPHRNPKAKPVVVYGTSVMHGGCVSRPGLVITSWASRLMDAEFVNLGFSGSGKMELVMSEMIAEIDASAYVLECLGNLTFQELKDRCEPFLRDLKKRRPRTPILLCENCDVRHDALRRFMRGVFDKLKAEDSEYWSNLHYLAHERWLPLDWDLTLDRTHPNDAGAYFASRALAAEVEGVLAEKSAEESDVSAFIQNEWQNTVRTTPVENGRYLRLPYEYTVPSVKAFQGLFYWDTYFTNVGLILSGRVRLAECNVRNIAHLIDRFGFMPNANWTNCLNRSQPPFFTRMVREVYAANKDRKFLSEMYGSAVKEFAFWSSHRKTQSGLFRYSGKFDCDRDRIEFGRYFVQRCRLPKTEDADRLRRYGDMLLSYAESGWDCTSRFPEHPQDGDWLDLNSLIYGMACDLAFFAAELGNGERAKWASVADRQRETMNRVLWDGDLEMFCDHDAVRDCRSDLVSAATFYPLFTKVATPEQAAHIVRQLPKLECRYGVAASENRNLLNYQWDYPHGWACLQLIVAQGLLNYGYTGEAKRIARKYVEVADKVFAETGALWEKYDVVRGVVSVTKEYKSPKMLGWSAGAYLWCKSQIRREGMKR